MISIEQIRHPKEKTYYGIMIFVSIIVYIILCITLFPMLLIGGFMIIFIILIIALIIWWGAMRFKAHIFGHSVNVNANQYPELHKIAENQAKELGITLPKIFIVNDGETNAFASKVFRGKYVLLNSGIVDVLLSTDRTKELESIIGHELGHHAAGHLSTLKKILLFPGKLIPFIGSAYSRSKELTCDRIAYVLTKDVEATQRGLFAIALGSSRLLKEGNMKIFAEQEREIPEIAAFFNKLYASHPRTTVRIKELSNYFNHRGNNYSSNVAIENTSITGSNINDDDLFN